jgi:hypothetical protein
VLKTCSHCDRRYDDATPLCPWCGRRPRTASALKIYWYLTLGIAALGAIALIAGVLGSS